MSSPTSPRTGANSTKQLLDELDALMQRMLELPVNETETAPASTTGPTVRVDPPTVLPEPPRSLHFSEPPPSAPTLETPQTWQPPPVRAPAFVPLADPPPPPVAPRFDHLGKPLVSEPARSPLGADVPRAATTTTRSLRGPYSPAVTTLPGGKPLPDAPQRREWVLRPLLWTNRFFDRASYLLGPAGRWLRGDLGRTVLGWCGLAMTAGAVGWGLFKLLG